MEFKLMKAAFEIIVNNTKDLVFLKDENYIYRACSVPFAKMAGKESPDEVIGKNDYELFDRELADRYRADDSRLIQSGKDIRDYMEPLAAGTKMARYGSTSKYVLRDSQGNKIGVLGITKDITTEYLARQRYQQEFRYLFELPEDTFSVSYIDVDDWRVISQRRQDVDRGTIEESSTIEQLCQHAMEAIADEYSEAYQFYESFSAEQLHEIYESGKRTLTFKYERKVTDGSKRWVRNDINFLTDVDSGHLCIMLSAKDITDIKLREQKIATLAKYDAMTNVFNREATMEYIRAVIVNEQESHHALFMLDLDNFKKLNDTYGHQVGDDFLVAIAQGIKSKFRESDIVGRIGGDEFFALMRGVTEREQIEHKAKELLDVITRVSKDYESTGISASIGISIFPRDGRTLDELYASADSALYKVKRNGKNSYAFAD